MSKIIEFFSRLKTRISEKVKEIGWKPIVRSVAIVVLLGVMIFCAWKIVSKLVAYIEDERAYQAAREDYRKVKDESTEEETVDPSTEEPDPNPPAISYYLAGDYSEHQLEQKLNLWHVDFDYILVPKYTFDFDELIKVNEDVKCWVLITDTNIDYPVVQCDNNDKYIRTGIDGEQHNAGSIFIDCRNDRPFVEYHTVLYGHNQRNGMMFHDIINYDDQEFADKHPYIFIYLPDGSYKVYQVFSSYEVNAYEDSYRIKFNSGRAFGEFVEMIKNRSTSHYNVEVDAGDKILSLSTCVNDFSDNPLRHDMRYIIHAKYLYTK